MSVSNFLNRIMGRHQPYNALPNNSNANLPGAFPGEEQVIANGNRNNTNSEAINQWMQWVGNWFNYLLIKPIIIFLVVSFRILAKFINVLYFKEKNNHYSSISNSEDGSPISSNHGHDPIDKVNKFVRDLEDNLTPGQLAQEGEYLPPFYQGSYTQALYMTTNRAKFLFVYLTNPHNESSSIIFKKIVTNPNFISLFSNQDVIIWGGDLTNPEAYQLANSLNVTRFPFLGLLCLTRTTTMSPQGPVKTSPKISLISKVQGGFGDELDVNQLIQNKFKKKIAKYEEELSLIRLELRDKFMSQVLLKQQDLNFQESLAKDIAKKNAKKLQKLTEQYLAYNAERFRKLKTNENTESRARIAIKLKDGSRTTVHFPIDWKVDDIYLFVELTNGGYLEQGFVTATVDNAFAEANFQDFKIDYKFKLSSPLPPRTNLDGLKDQYIKDVECVYPNGLLIVEDL
ncbi:uncharacterized protein RJT20DRAFT_129692 [Scheffersomyces xylosifermentans]|uniref:uncharacterized protein n=1 Tax=Scheffersomyces xylosifermentans TaxID=1304137 RepID=UPI00315DB41E